MFSLLSSKTEKLYSQIESPHCVYFNLYSTLRSVGVSACVRTFWLQTKHLLIPKNWMKMFFLKIKFHIIYSWLFNIFHSSHCKLCCFFFTYICIAFSIYIFFFIMWSNMTLNLSDLTSIGIPAKKHKTSALVVHFWRFDTPTGEKCWCQQVVWTEYCLWHTSWLG